MRDDPFDHDFGTGPSLLDDEDDTDDPFEEVRSMQRRMVLGLGLGALAGLASAGATFQYAEPEIGVWAVALSLVVSVLVGYGGAALCGAVLAFGGGWR